MERCDWPIERLEQSPRLRRDSREHDAPVRRVAASSGEATSLQAIEKARDDNFRPATREAIVPVTELFPLARGSLETMLISHALRRTHTGHRTADLGTGRSMACRPIGLCPPERFDRGWSANRGPRCTRVSAMRGAGFGGASRVRSLRTPRPARRVSARRGIG